jgi:signal transduction histidine kinase
VTFGGALEQDQLVLYVQDNGPGIPAEHQDRLFQKGERLIKKGERKVRGSGLGLYIVKNVALQHGGDARVDSEPGRGSRFMITIPLVAHNLVGASTTEE